MVNAYAADIAHSWSDDGTSIRLDVVCLVLAIGIHIPLYFMKIDASKKAIDTPSERLIAVDLLEQMAKPVEAPAEVAPTPAEQSLMDKLKMLVKREPPPPVVAPKPVVEPPKPVDAPKPIALEAKLDLPKPIDQKLDSKAGFKTAVDPELVKEKQLALNNAPAGIAPLSAQKLGTIEDRAAAKQDRGKFLVSQNEKLSSIDDSKGPSLAGAAPVLAIRTGAQASTEKFSAPGAQKSDKGRIGAVPEIASQKLGFRDSIIARDAAPTQIGGTGPSATAGNIPVAKRDAGTYQMAAAPALVNNSNPKVAIGNVPTVAPISAAPIQQALPKEKKKMFQITGPLADRKIITQVAPEYPEWAQQQGIESTVVLEFTVDSAGDVKPTIIVRRTTGYQKLDDVAIQALRRWKFVPLTDVNRDEVGLITFNFSLH